MTDLNQTNVKKIIMERTGITEGQFKKLEQLLSNGFEFPFKFKMPISKGRGTCQKPLPSYFLTISGHAIITDPDDGSWHIVVKDGDNVIADKNGVTKNQEVPFGPYKTGSTVNLSVTATWSKMEDTTLNVDMLIKF